ncbi:hypothetical protein EVJ58_g2089 [Rhodofomes roseus]|uniref:MFS transporter n=1 Tax=Rhodofomes roseus TaxID=34475 RepID=A0A4Y9YVU4_9APHY|nr:hypothetical protein EVJ58_g2089 [Rhodofomes roseus]
MSPHPPQDVVDTTDGHPVVFSEPAVGRPLRQGEDVTACSQKTSAMVALTMLSVAYIFNVLIMVDVVYETLYMPGYNTKILLHLWDGLLVVVLGSVLCTASRGVQGNTSGLMWFGTIARGIGIGGTYPAASTIAFDILNKKTTHGARAFVMMTNFVFNAGGMLATIVFVIVLAAAQPGHLDTVWPVCIGIGIVIPLAAISYSTLRTTSRRLRSRAMKCMCPLAHVLPDLSQCELTTSTLADLSMYSSEAKQHWVAMVRTACLWFVYDFILVSFVGYVIFALIIGSAYDRLLNVTPLLVVLYALMLFMGNLGPGNLLSLIASESYPSNVRGSFYGVNAAFGTAGAIAGIHAFATIDDNLRKQWGFIIAALCGVLGIIITCFLPSGPDILPANLSEKEATRNVDRMYITASDAQSQCGSHLTRGDDSGIACPPKGNTSAISYADKDVDLYTNEIAVPVVNDASGPRDPGSHPSRLLDISSPPHASPTSCTLAGSQPEAIDNSPSDVHGLPSTRVLLLQRMSMDVPLEYVTPALNIQEAHEVIAEHVAVSRLQKFFKEDDVFVKTVEANAAKLQDDGQSFPVTKQNVQRLIRLSLYYPVIYCDDSHSMSWDVPTRWELQREAVARVANITTRALPPSYGVGLRFINAQWAARDNIPSARVLEAVDAVAPSSGTPLGTHMRQYILRPLVYDVLDAGRLLERPILICVITDGCPYGEYETTFEDAITECRQRLVDAGYEPTAVRFCVNQIGGDEGSTLFLDSLRNNPSINDVVYCTTERLDLKFKLFRENGRLLDEWLLHMLSNPIMHRIEN